MHRPQRPIEGAVRKCTGVFGISFNGRIIICDNAVIDVRIFTVEGVHELPGLIHHLFARIVFKQIRAVDFFKMPKLRAVSITSAVVSYTIFDLSSVHVAIDIEVEDKDDAVFGEGFFGKLAAEITVQLRSFLLTVGIHENRVNIAFSIAPVTDAIIKDLRLKYAIALLGQPLFGIFICFAPDINPISRIYSLIPLLTGKRASHFVDMPIMCGQWRYCRRKVIGGIGSQFFAIKGYIELACVSRQPDASELLVEVYHTGNNSNRISRAILIQEQAVLAGMHFGLIVQIRKG